MGEEDFSEIEGQELEQQPPGLLDMLMENLGDLANDSPLSENDFIWLGDDMYDDEEGEEGRGHQGEGNEQEATSSGNE